MIKEPFQAEKILEYTISNKIILKGVSGGANYHQFFTEKLKNCKNLILFFCKLLQGVV
ncbi:MAG TPA: hypothetical protein P5239_11570 [Victivallales bacterium]|nr:hypothetical protein [Victivallales bacterium]